MLARSFGTAPQNADDNNNDVPGSWPTTVAVRDGLGRTKARAIGNAAASQNSQNESILPRWPCDVTSVFCCKGAVVGIHRGSQSAREKMCGAAGRRRKMATDGLIT